MQMALGLQGSQPAIALAFQSFQAAGSLTKPPAEDGQGSTPALQATAGAMLSGLTGACCAESGVQLAALLTRHSAGSSPSALTADVTARAGDSLGAADTNAAVPVAQRPEEQQEPELTPAPATVDEVSAPDALNARQSKIVLQA